MLTEQDIKNIREGLATKEDLERFATKEDLAGVKAELGETRTDLANLEDKVDKLTEIVNDQPTKKELAEVVAKAIDDGLKRTINLEVIKEEHIRIKEVIREQHGIEV